MYKPSSKEVQAFRNKLRRWYRAHGRHDLPWRQTTDPYRILVSECMLQQTQVSRVVPKYGAFLERFPTTEALRDASTADVLLLWQGLGYNRRALALKRAAETIVREHAGVFPHDVRALEKLPGVGPYTARAVLVFAYNEPEVLVETNIRTVMYEYFFPQRERVADEELDMVLRAVLPRRRVREWYWACMDYGSALKGRGVRRNKQNPQYQTQQPFKGSNREIRGAILKEVAQKGHASRRELLSLGFASKRVLEQLAALMREGLIECDAHAYRFSR